MQDEGNETQDSPDQVRELNWSPGSNRAALGGSYELADLQESPETPMQQPPAYFEDTEGDDVLCPRNYLS